MANEDKPSHALRNIHWLDELVHDSSDFEASTGNKRYTPKPISINLRWKISCDTITPLTKIEMDCIYNFTLLYLLIV